MTQLDVKHVSFSYDGSLVLDDISFEAKPGELIAFVGPSGCGKTTLLRCIAGLLAPQSGSVTFNSSSTHGTGHYAFVFQRPTLLPWLTVKENLALPYKIRRESVPDEELGKQIGRIGLSGFESYLPSQLSIGMAQRVAFVRAASGKPNLLLLDEPFSALDELTKRELAAYLSDIVASATSTGILVTHSIQDAVFLADRVFVLGRRPTHIVTEISIELPKPRGWMAPRLIHYVDQIRAALEKTK